MTSRLRAHLWLEWREHRALVVGIVAVTLLGVTFMARYCVERNFGSADGPAFAAMVVAALVVLTLGGEILGRELVSDGRAALARLPAALATPFFLRIAFFCTVVAASSTLAWWTMYIALRAFSVKPILEIATVDPKNIAILVALVSAWTLATSCWTRKTPHAAPLALLLLAAFFAPLWIRIEGHPIIERIESSAPFLLGLAVVAGLVAAWRSFTRGHRAGTGRAGAIRAGAVAFVLIAPIHLTAAYRTYEWISLDPTREDYRIWNAIVGDGARYAYVTARRAEHGRLGDDFYGFVVDLRVSACSEAKVGQSFAVAREFEGRLAFPSATWCLEPLVASYVPHREPKYHIVDAHENVVLGDSDAFRSGSFSDAKLDLLRRLYVDSAPLEPWPPNGWRENDQFVAAESHDAILLFEFDVDAVRGRGLATTFPLHRLNRQTGERTAIVDIRGTGIEVTFGLGPQEVGRRATCTPSGSVVFQAKDAEGRAFAARLARDETRATTTRACIQRVAAILDDDTILAVLDDGRSLAKLRFDGTEPEILFPRPGSRCVDELFAGFETESR